MRFWVVEVRTERTSEELFMAFLFGLFQAVMPLLGWLGGLTFSHLMENFDHWVAFTILAFLGARMIKESFKDEEEKRNYDPTNIKVVLALAVATSLDALAIGLSFAILGRSNISTMKEYFAPSELIINDDGSVFHLHVKPEQLADKVILVGDPGRVAVVASHFDHKECEVESREFKTITGTYKGKRITVVSTGIGCDNIDIVMNELDALANIDFSTRKAKATPRQLELVRIGTCGGLQPNTPVGTFVCSRKSIGFDGLLNFYAGRNEVCDLEFEQAFLKYMGWTGSMLWRPSIAYRTV